MSFSSIERGTILIARRMLSVKKLPEKIPVSQICVRDNQVEIKRIGELDWSFPNFYDEEIENENFKIIKYKGYDLVINSTYNSY